MFEKIKNSKLMFWSVEILIIATLILSFNRLEHSLPRYLRQS